MRTRPVFRSLAAGILWIAGSAAAAPMTEAEVPAPLKPWIGWVLHDRDPRGCALGGDDGRACDWPSSLSLDLGNGGGAFGLQLRLDAAGWVALPGGEEQWPQEVRVDSRPAPVSLHNGHPALYLPAGNYTVSGRFEWAHLPEALPLPASLGLASLRVNGAERAHPARDANGLWLGRGAQQAAAGDSLNLQVYRLVDDDIPLRVITHLQVEAAGAVREAQLGPVLPAGMQPLSIDSPLPARLDEQGVLHLQLRPGVWSIEVTARAPAPVQELALPKLAGPWPAEEVWSFAAHNGLRIVEVGGGTPVDPQQTQVPPPWRAYPAYAMKAGEALRFDEKQRGDPHPQPGQLSLQRRLWLDFDGGGYTVEDRIGGQLNDRWRLGVAAPLHLGSASLDGAPQPITRLGADDQGVEVRHGAVDLVAASRVDQRLSHLPVTGWDHEFQQVSAELNLPPGWRLLATSGVDNVPQTWVSRWSLLDLFAVLVAASAALRLFGPRWAALMLLTLALSWQEPAAPRWSWLNLLAAAALLRALPESLRGGRLALWLGRYRALAAVLVVLLAIPFALQQARNALHPQLEQDAAPLNPLGIVPQARLAQTAPLAEAPPGPEQEKDVAEAATNGPATTAESPLANVTMAPGPPQQAAMAARRKAAGKTADYSARSSSMQRIDPSALTPTGPGLPDWSWRAATLSWSGPIAAEQSFRLWLLPPFLTRLLEVLSILLVAAMLGRCVELRRPPLPPGPTGAAAAALLLVLLGSLPWPARADAPPADAAPPSPIPALLDELRARLLAAPDCAPDCAESPRLWLGLDADQVLNLRLTVDALAPVAVPLPVPALAGGEQGGVWQPQRVLVDGGEVPLRRGGNGGLWARLGPGHHELLLSGSVAGLGQLQLPLPLKPRRVSAQLHGWLLSGVDDDGQAADTLQLLRQSADSGATAGNGAGQALPPLLQVTRTLRLGLDWQVETTVERLGVPYTPVNTEIPLLAGEAVTSAGVRVHDGAVQLSLAPGQAQAQWTSRLANAASLSLHAAQRDDLFEVWRLDIAPIWHAEAGGLAPVSQQENGWRLPSYQPWPGESLELKLSRPQGLPGQTLTLDGASLVVTPGQHASEETLELRLRSSQGGQYALPLPAGSTVSLLVLDGEAQPAHIDNGRLILGLKPGAQQVQLGLRSGEGISWNLRTPALELGMPGVNARIDLELPQDRWILATGGPRMGPAVLFWGVLAVLLGVAAVLGRSGLAPLGTVQWALLFVGLSQIPVWAAAVVVGWFAALTWRGRRGEALSAGRFKLLQGALVLLTLLSLGLLFQAVAAGLLGQPDMQIAGNGSWSHSLHWYQDRFGQALPQARVWSAPLWLYRLLMLLWALWLANALLRWLRWGWSQFNAGGLWRQPAPLQPQPGPATPPPLA
ncbi:MAG TPA: hypothetical protein VFA75_15135 [Nevskia sp.]|nr:hypothetical protein [Nevskia sp.]